VQTLLLRLIENNTVTDNCISPYENLRFVPSVLLV